MGQTVSSETLVFNLDQTPGNYPKEDDFKTMNHGESLKFNTILNCLPVFMAPIFKKETRNNLTHTYPNKSLD
jgi:hypothetical protein